MGWHDSPIYAFSFNTKNLLKQELILDIEYIFEWVNPVAPNNTFSFWVAPSTIIFETILNTIIASDTTLFSSSDLKIADIHRLEELPNIDGHKQ
jgi:hypothetical protein